MKDASNELNEVLGELDRTTRLTTSLNAAMDDPEANLAVLSKKLGQAETAFSSIWGFGKWVCPLDIVSMTPISQRFLSTTAAYLPTTYNAAITRYDNMPFRRAGRSGLLLPSLSLGLWQNFGDADPIANSQAILRCSFDLGITHFDLANNYGPPQGAAERTFGRILNTDFRAYRDEMLISTKAGFDMWPGPYGEWGSRK